MNTIDVHELNTEKNGVFRFDDHYAAISNNVPKSIPEIKRQFMKTFKFGGIYLGHASKVLQQPSYHAKQILKLKDLYTIESLDKILGYCIKNSIFEIDDIKGVLKEKYIEIVLGEIVDPIAYSNKTTHSLARDLSYYEGGAEIE